MSERKFSFIGGDRGLWKVLRMDTVKGSLLAPVEAVEIRSGHPDKIPPHASWMLNGITSYERYVQLVEQELLVARQPELNRVEATLAVLIPIRKSSAWWSLPQDERRAIFESRSGHIRTGLKYLPAIARRLHHGHDAEAEFDFLTWFEFAPSHLSMFDELVWKLRNSEEWNYVEREIDIRLIRQSKM